MDIEKYTVIITPTAYIEEKIQQLKEMPKIYPKIEISNELQREYRRIIINNYIILYTIEEDNKRVFISHMYYRRKNYFDNK